MKFLLFGLCLAFATPSYDIEALKQWRVLKEKRLKADGGWLSVAGLSWLKEGANSLGSAFDADLKLPSSAPRKLGQIDSVDGKYWLSTYRKGLRLGGRTLKKGERLRIMASEEEDQVLSWEDLEFYLIERKNGVGLRVKDPEAKSRKNFKGLSWYPAQAEYSLVGNWVAYKKPKKLMIPDVIGNVNEELSPGFVRFNLNGKEYRLHPTQSSSGDLFFVFKDKTNGRETYSASRFLYADPPSGGRVTLDFNRAYNPPCAFTQYATCPRAPDQNVLDVAIPAGEKKPL